MISKRFDTVFTENDIDIFTASPWAGSPFEGTYRFDGAGNHANWYPHVIAPKINGQRITRSAAGIPYIHAWDLVPTRKKGIG